jgi:hypothetical protein
MYLLLADLVVIIHFLFILLVVFGGLLVIRWKKLIRLHLPVLGWGIFIELSGWICPLTPLETWFRRQAEVDIYQGGFISHYLVPIIYPPGLTSNTQWLLAAGLIVTNVVIYAYIFLYQGKTR